MIFRTHLAFGLLIGLLFFYFGSVENWILFSLFLFFGIGFPDIDSKESKFGRKLIFRFLNFFLKHRGIFHSLIFGIVISYLLFYFDKSAGAGFFLGFLSHIILDSFTKEGVKIFYPIFNFNFKGFVKTNSLTERIIFYTIVVLNVIVVAKLLNRIVH